MIRGLRIFFGAVWLVALLRTAIFLWGTELPWFGSEYGQYQHILFYRSKLFDLLFHVGGVLVLIAYFFATYRYIVRNGQGVSECQQGRQVLFLWFTVIFAMIVMLWHPDKPSGPIEWGIFAGLLVLWLVINFELFSYEGFYNRFFLINWNKQWNPANTGRVYMALAGIAVVQLLFVISPFAIGPLQLLNEFPDIPSITILYHANKEVVDKDYIDERGLFGPARRYSPERDRGQTPSIDAAVCFLFEPAPGLSSFLLQGNNRHTFLYSKQEKKLCAIDTVSPEQWLDLRLLTVNSEDLQRLDAWYVAVREFDQKLQEKVLSLTDKQFYRANQFVMGFQFTGMGVIHHHGFLLNPLNEYDLGKPRSEIYAQYGWLNLWVTHGLMKLLGEIEYQNYFRVWYSYYYLYYFLYFGLLWLLFRNRGYLAAGALLSVGLLCFIDYQWLLQPPGINPVRRIMEIPLILGLFYYWKTCRTRYLLITVAALWLGILNNWQFSLMALGATGFSLSWYRWSRRKEFSRTDDIIFIVGLLGSFFLIAWMKGSPDPLSHFYLAGSATLPLSEWIAMGILAFFSLGGVVLLRTFDDRRPMSYLCLFLLLYTSAMMTYSIWNGTPTYLLVPGPLYVLLLLAFAFHITEVSSDIRPGWNGMTIAFLVCFGSLVFLAGSWSQEKTRTEFLGLMASHKTYQWKLDRAKFISTMEPRYFEDGVDLIQRYSKEPNIYIISKYDNFLPFLAKRYSAMPYFELAKFLISPRETQECVERLMQDKPHLLFVDTDIRRDFATDVVHLHAPLGAANGISRYHVEQMRSLQRIFMAVEKDYELVEQGLLISVYRRKQDQ